MKTGGVDATLKGTALILGLQDKGMLCVTIICAFWSYILIRTSQESYPIFYWGRLKANIGINTASRSRSQSKRDSGDPLWEMALVMAFLVDSAWILLANTVPSLSLPKGQDWITPVGRQMFLLNCKEMTMRSLVLAWTHEASMLGFDL